MNVFPLFLEAPGAYSSMLRCCSWLSLRSESRARTYMYVLEYALEYVRVLTGHSQPVDVEASGGGVHCPGSTMHCARAMREFLYTEEWV